MCHEQQSVAEQMQTFNTTIFYKSNTEQVVVLLGINFCLIQRLNITDFLFFF